MSKFNELEIKVNKARISSISIEFKENAETEPTFTVNGELITEQGFKLSTFSLHSNKEAWYAKERVVDIPAGVHARAIDMFEQLMPVIYEKLNGMFTPLPAGQQTEQAKREAEIVSDVQAYTDAVDGEVVDETPSEDKTQN